MNVPVAFLFPGQGSQMVGMGVALAEESLSAKRVFEQVNDAIGEDLFAIMKDGPSEVLQLTRNAQPAIFASSLAVVKAIEERFGSIENHTSFVAGHSLGEYSALAAANSLDISAAAMLLRIRGDAMQSATPIGTGAMAAILGADINQIDRLIESFYAENNENLEQIVQIANDNAPGQIVVSGHKQAVEKLCDMAKQAGIKRSLMLPVSAPFHSDLMAPACDVMSEHLANSEFRQPEITLMCNVTAAAEADIYQLRVNLVNQVTAKVRWRETLLNLSSQGVTQFVEIGTGKILSGLVKRTVSDAEIVSLQSFQDITHYFS